MYLATEAQVQLPLLLVLGCCLPWCAMHMFSCMAGNNFGVKGVGQFHFDRKGKKSVFFLL